MKLNDLYTGWYDYDNSEYKKLLKESMISFDANLLLDFYRYSKYTSESIFTALNPIKDRIVTSKYVLNEFTKNRKGVKAKNLDDYKELNESLNEKNSSIKAALSCFGEKKKILLKILA